jgi:ribosomal protein S18 acetylase RimI-like enzyme
MTGAKKWEIRVLAPGEEERARRVLDKDPYRNIWMLACLERYGLFNLGLPEQGSFYGYFQHEELKSLLYCNNLGFWRFHASDASELISLLDSSLGDGLAPLSLTGDPRVLEESLEGWGQKPPIEIMEREVIMVLRSGDFSPSPEREARLARLEDLADMVELERGLQLHLLGRSAERSFLRRHFRQLIGEGKAAVYPLGEKVVSKAEMEVEVGALVQVSGVYTLPEHRCWGYASASCSFLCRRALKEGKEVCLETQRDNREALHLYRKLGFNKYADSLIVRFKADDLR